MCVCVYIKKKVNKLYKQTRLKTKPQSTKKTMCLRFKSLNLKSSVTMVTLLSLLWVGAVVIPAGPTSSSTAATTTTKLHFFCYMSKYKVFPSNPETQN